MHDEITKTMDRCRRALDVYEEEEEEVSPIRGHLLHPNVLKESLYEWTHISQGSEFLLKKLKERFKKAKEFKRHQSPLVMSTYLDRYFTITLNNHQLWFGICSNCKLWIRKR